MYYCIMASHRNPSSINRRIREGLSRLATTMRIDDWQRAKAAGLNPTQLSILELIEGRSDGMSVKDIAAHLGVSQPTATDSIIALERKGLITKTSSTADRRAVNITLTDDGLSALQKDNAPLSVAEQAAAALAAGEQENMLLMLAKMIRHLQEIEAIPIQRMCVNCCYFVPFAHTDAERPHHCNFVDAAFGQRDIRIDCHDHETADPALQSANWDAFRQGSASNPPGS